MIILLANWVSTALDKAKHYVVESPRARVEEWARAVYIASRWVRLALEEFNRSVLVPALDREFESSGPVAIGRVDVGTQP